MNYHEIIKTMQMNIFNNIKNLVIFKGKIAKRQEFALIVAMKGMFRRVQRWRKCVFHLQEGRERILVLLVF